MSGLDLNHSRNIIIRAMDEEDRALLAPHLSRTDLNRDEPLVTADQPIRHVWFPEAGIVSVVADRGSGRRTEVGIFGREGMSGIAMLMGSDRMPMSIFTQIDGGTALRIDAARLREACAGSASLRELLLRFCYCFLIQSAFSTVANAQHLIEARLARWLLMCHDRADGDEIPLTHAFTAMMVAAQRTGVTHALHMLEGEGMIRARRGRVTILDRTRLMRLAADSYGVPEAEYRRLIGSFGK